MKRIYNSVSLQLMLTTLLCFTFISTVNGQWKRETINANAANQCAVFHADLDTDGDMDIIASSGFSTGELIWYENDGNANWTMHKIATNRGGVGISVYDINADDKPDIIYCSYMNNKVYWYQNNGGSPLTWTEHVAKSCTGPEISCIGDMDNDGDMDIVVALYTGNSVIWLENEGNGSTWTSHTIDNSMTGAAGCQAKDLNSDGMPDVACVSSSNGVLAFYLNENNGQNWTKSVIDNTLSGWSNLDAGDYDKDGDPDIVATGSSVSDVVVYENVSGNTISWNKHVVDGSLTGAFGTKFKDINSDGLLDVLATATNAGDVVWYKNNGGSPDEWTKITIDANLPSAWDCDAADFNGNGYPEVVANQEYTIANGILVMYTNPYGPAWQQMASMDVKRNGTTSCVLNNLIYVFGGRSNSGFTLDSADVYNTETNEWHNLAPVPVDLQSSSAEVINNKIYLTGGWRQTTSFFTIDSTFEYDPSNNEWTSKKPCPKKTGLNSSCVYNDTLYLFGGFNSTDQTGQQDALTYDPVNNSWDNVAEMIYKRGSAGIACVYDEQIYVIGGLGNYNGSGVMAKKPEKYSPGNGTWTELAEMPVPVIYHGGLIYKNKVYIFGGARYYGGDAINTIQEYDPETDSWRLMEGMPFNRIGSLNKVNNYAYIIGGDDGHNVSTAEVWRFNLDSLKEGCEDINIVQIDQTPVPDNIKVGESVRLFTNILPSDFANKTLEWTSDNESVAIFENGYIKGISEGTATITAKLKYGSCSDSHTVQVNGPAWQQVNNTVPGDLTCISENKIYVFGCGTSATAIGNKAWSYNTGTDTWTQLNDMPVGITEGGIGCIGDKIYLAGGWQGNWAATDSVLMYDTSNGTYAFNSKIPLKLGSSGSCLMDNKMYLFGGWGFPFPNVYHPYVVLSYDPESGSGDITSVPNMNYPHVMHATAEVIDGEIYVIGGVDLPSSYNVQRSEKFDGEKWSPIAEMPVPVTAHRSIVHDNKILVFGGDSLWTQNKSYSVNCIQEYDPVMDTWRLLKQTMPFNRSALGGGKIGNFVYLTGGYSDDRNPNTFANDIWRFNLDSLYTGFQEVRKTNDRIVSVYPNPTSSSVIIKALNSELYHIEIIALNGQTLYETSMTELEKQVDVSGLNTGLYLLRISSGNIVITEKLIKL
ncbi:kelch repeat-containing protein [Saccharicrinis sp. FJH62]|uniref:Kelch repeat-containing protein n=1 Tax=Saccharicrinis sp. FJH62 TaxID=3344657 RepID=UPI0035D4B7B7